MIMILFLQVVYPGLKSYEQFELARSQSDGPGAMLAVYFKGGLSAAGAFLSKLKALITSSVFVREQ